MLKSGFYNRSKALGSVVPGMLFDETHPPRWRSMIPLLNFWNRGKVDNNWVSLELLADNKTFVGTTDTKNKLEIDFETLDTRQLIEFEDDVNCMNGVSHSRKL